MVNPGATPPHDPPDHKRGDTSEQISAFIPDPLPRGALAENVEGRKIATAEDGFGKLWRKRYAIQLTGSTVTPTELINVWTTHYTEFWPKGSRLHQAPGGLKQGDVAAADLSMIGGVRVGTGIVVIDKRDTSFTLATLQGHTFCGTITFSAPGDIGVPVAYVEAILRAGDPLYEIGMTLGGHWYENRFWKATLVALAEYYGIDSQPTMEMECLDTRRKWRNATNIVHNAFLHTAAYLVARQIRHLAHALQSKGRST